jgi:hypothetical protein
MKETRLIKRETPACVWPLTFIMHSHATLFSFDRDMKVWESLMQMQTLACQLFSSFDLDLVIVSSEAWFTLSKFLWSQLEFCMGQF